MTSGWSDLPLFEFTSDAPEVAELLRLLLSRGWMTRKQISEATDWPERTIRAIAEAAGSKIVRGQRGFIHASHPDLTLDDIDHAADQAISQGKIMIRYGVALRRLVHQKVG